jgi:hypothetical protein
MTLENTQYRDATPCSVVKTYRCVCETYCLRTLKKQAEVSTKYRQILNYIARHHVPEEIIRVFVVPVVGTARFSRTIPEFSSQNVTIVG